MFVRAALELLLRSIRSNTLILLLTLCASRARAVLQLRLWRHLGAGDICERQQFIRRAIVQDQAHAEQLEWCYGSLPGLQSDCVVRKRDGIGSDYVHVRAALELRSIRSNTLTLLL